MSTRSAGLAGIRAVSRHRCVTGARSRRRKTSVPPHLGSQRQFFSPEISSPRADGLVRHFAASKVPTGFSTAPNNAPESHEKPKPFHPQFTHNPQLVHGLPSGFDTLAVADSHASPPKSSGAFSCPTPATSLQERRCDCPLGHSNWREPSSAPAETVTGAVTSRDSKLQSCRGGDELSWQGDSGR